MKEESKLKTDDLFTISRLLHLNLFNKLYTSLVNMGAMALEHLKSLKGGHKAKKENPNDSCNGSYAQMLATIWSEGPRATIDQMIKHVAALVTHSSSFIHRI